MEGFDKKQLALACLPYLLRQVLAEPAIRELLATIESKGSQMMKTAMEPPEFRRMIENLGAKPVQFKWGTDVSHGSNQKYLFRVTLSHLNYQTGEGWSQSPGEIYHPFLEGLEEMTISYGHTLKIVR